jgi:light-regulated signal transduction histidine kinase (bacteriophytochrome)
MRTDRELAALLFRACHDLRTPNRSILAHAELLLKDTGTALPADLDQRLGFVIDGARKIERLVDALAGYALALDTDPSSFQSTRLDIVLRGVLARIEQPLLDHCATVHYSELPRVKGNPDRLMQLFAELLDNSLSHRGEAAPRIEISSSPNDEGCLISVSDNGTGVDPADLERIFNPFERLHGKSAGLGLAACRAIVEGHGGRIWSQLGASNGLDVRFTLPPA